MAESSWDSSRQIRIKLFCFCFYAKDIKNWTHISLFKMDTWINTPCLEHDGPDLGLNAGDFCKRVDI